MSVALLHPPLAVDHPFAVIAIDGGGHHAGRPARRASAFSMMPRYDDETGTAPIRTGYSEVVFGELFRGAGIRRDEAVVANKLWWEFWPGQSAAAELDASLRRMGLPVRSRGPGRAAGTLADPRVAPAIAGG